MSINIAHTRIGNQRSRSRSSSSAPQEGATFFLKHTCKPHCRRSRSCSHPSAAHRSITPANTGSHEARHGSGLTAAAGVSCARRRIVRSIMGGSPGAYRRSRDMLVPKRTHQIWMRHGGLAMHASICGNQLRRRRGRGREWSAAHFKLQLG